MGPGIPLNSFDSYGINLADLNLDQVMDDDEDDDLGSSKRKKNKKNDKKRRKGKKGKREVQNQFTHSGPSIKKGQNWKTDEFALSSQ